MLIILQILLIFWRVKPNKNNTYTYESSEHVYIKSYRKMLRRFILHKRCYTTLEWIMRRDKDKIYIFVSWILCM